MADPIIPGGIRVQFILPGRSGLAEDRYITTWAFRTADNLPPSPALLQTAALNVLDFFIGITAPATAAVRTYLGAAVNQPAAEARVYRLGDAPPREPTIFPVNVGAISAAAPLPSEVALCASFFAGRNLPRQRGRVYIGPLSTSASASQAVDNGAARPVPGLVTALTTSMKRLQADSVTDGLRWCVLSQTDGVMKDVTAGWCDNAFDTQRRRGEDATTRTTWTSFA